MTHFWVLFCWSIVINWTLYTMEESSNAPPTEFEDASEPGASAFIFGPNLQFELDETNLTTGADCVCPSFPRAYIGELKDPFLISLSILFLCRDKKRIQPRKMISRRYRDKRKEKL